MEGGRRAELGARNQLNICSQVATEPTHKGIDFPDAEQYRRHACMEAL